MAFPFKTGGDFYNCEAQRMRLHNLGANPTETATGLMYFNTGASNLGKHAVVHDGTNFKALAFVDEIATNAEFVELKEKVDHLIGDDVDMDGIIESWKEVEAFLAGMKDTENLIDLLNSKADKTQLANYLPLSGGTMTGTITMSHNKENRTHPIEFNDASWIGYLFQEKEKLYWGHSNTAANAYALLHSGNITEVLDDLNNATGARFFAGTFQASNRPNTGVNFAAGLTINDIATGILHQISFDNTGNLFARSQKSDGWRDWKTIAFTDSDITGYSAGLKHSNGTVGAVVNSLGNVTIGDQDLAGTRANLFVDGVAAAALFRFVNNDDTTGSYIGRPSAAHNDILLYIPTANDFYIATNGTERMRINANGNVLIGTTEDNGGKLQVEGYVSISNNNGIYFKDSGGTIRSQLYVDKNNNTSFGYGAIETNGNTKIYGTNITFLTSATHQRMSINNNGDIRIYGNLIVDGEVSAGGAGQEGESGDGGAEVLAQQLASGQSTYTITNTIKRSDIAVSLYEANVINGQTIWSLCLADIEVTNETITVTFGSATSVNHKLVAVG